MPERRGQDFSTTISRPPREHLPPEKQTACERQSRAKNASGRASQEMPSLHEKRETSPSLRTHPRDSLQYRRTIPSGVPGTRGILPTRRQPAPHDYKRYQATLRTGKQSYKGLQVIVPREGKNPLVATWGGIPLKKRPLAPLHDQPRHVWNSRTELEQRLLADTCELCGSHDRITVHHIRALKDLDQYGRRAKPRWAKIMAARRRKTLIVCWPCHMSIQYGKPLKKVTDRNRV